VDNPCSGQLAHRTAERKVPNQMANSTQLVRALSTRWASAGALHPVARALAFAGCLFVAQGLTACSRGLLHNRVVVIPRLSADAQWLSLHVGIAEAAERAHLATYWNGPSMEADTQSQIELVERAVDDGAYGIVIRPNAFFTMNRVIQKALDRKIPVVIFSEQAGMPPAHHLSFILNDMNETGSLIANRLNEILHGRGDIVIAGLQPQTPGSIDRSDAIESSLRRLAPHIHIAEKTVGAYSVGYSEQTLEDVIRKHPRLHAIVALNAQEGFGAVAAVRSMQAEARIRVIVCDQGLDLLSYLRHGSLDSLLVENMRGIGNRAVENIVSDRIGDSYPSPIVLNPSLVTRENIDTEPVQQLLLMHRSRH
jgi:ABC-type sugar transport system substrate-binding protein